MRHLVALCLAVTPLSAQTVRYTVAVQSPAAQLFRVTAEFPTGGRDTLLVSLPAWSPGHYEINNYARFVRGFAAKNAAGQAVFWDRADKDTWRIATGKSGRVTVEFEVLADTIDLSHSRIRGDFGVFLGTNLFPFEEGHLERPAEVRFQLPSGWQVTTALRGAGPYTATDYHELADAMTFVGRYSLDSLSVDGRWIRLAVWPGDAYTAAVAANMRASLEKIARAQAKLMGDLPCPVYTVFFNVIREPIAFGGGLEHTCSQYDILPQQAFADEAGNLGPFMNPLMSHELFHHWNVKRIRPAEMWPYDYRAEQYTPLLWWAEGVTDYYADLMLWRSGIWTEQEFLNSARGNMQTVEAIPEPWSAEDGSIATWINEIYTNSSQMYYPKGALLGMLLDVSIRDATNNAKSLDDVTRALYTRYYEKGKGFTTADLLALLREFGLADGPGFYQRYINGREPLPYEDVLARAGIAVERTATSIPYFGVSTGVTPEGQVQVVATTAGSAAERAGVTPGDVLIKVGEVTVTVDTDWGAEFRAKYRGKAGSPLTVAVRRGDQTLTLNTEVRERSAVQFNLTKAPRPSAKQAKVWQGLASGATGS